MVDSLLPPNATPEERAIEGSTARLADIPADLAKLWRPDDCPLELLPWLAWSLSVDDWDPNWPEAQQRQVIRDAARLHRSKGTVGAVKRALANLGVTVDMLEWFEHTDDVALARIHSSEPHTFVFIAWANANPYISNRVFLNPELYAVITRAVENTKPLRSHFDFLVGARLDSGLAAGASSGGWLQSGRFSQQTKPVQVPKTISTLSAGFHLNNRRLAVARYYMVESPGVAE